MVIINGEKKAAEGLTISEYLAQEDLSPERIAVMLGDRIVPKGEFGDIVLSEGDTLEIVGFVGGGA